MIKIFSSPKKEDVEFEYNKFMETHKKIAEPQYSTACYYNNIRNTLYHSIMVEYEDLLN